MVKSENTLPKHQLRRETCCKKGWANLTHIWSIQHDSCHGPNPELGILTCRADDATNSLTV